MLTLSIEQLSNQYRYVLVSHETVGNDLKLVYKRHKQYVYWAYV